ncbi:MAG: hypothetical protein ACK4SX_12950 [Alcanivoracaceae bacterium]
MSSQSALRRLIACLILPGLLAPSLISAQVWHLVHPRPTPESLSSCVKHGSAWFAAGQFGTVLRSPDGIVWEKSANLITDSVSPPPDIEDVVSGGGQLVAISLISAYHSSDGISWSAPSLFENDFSFYGRAVIYDGSQYVVAGNTMSGDGRVYTSSDALSWTMQALPVSTPVRGIAFDGSRYVVVGHGGMIYTSENLISWTERTPPSAVDINSVAYGPAGFVAAPALPGTVFTSEDGVSWGTASMASGSSGNVVTFDGQRYLNVSGAVFSSTDGASWSQVYSPENGLLVGLCGDGAGRAVVVGTGGHVASSMNINGTGWLARTPSLSQLISVASNGSRFVAVGEQDTLLTSGNGASWDAVDLSVLGPFGGATITSVLWLEELSLFAAVRDLSLFTSDNGIDWSVATLPESGSSLAWSGERAVIAGSEGKVIYSDDLGAWQSVAIDSTAPLGVRYLNDRFVIWERSFSGRSYVSVDGESWTPGNAGALSLERSMAFGNGVYTTGKRYSVDALNWQVIDNQPVGIAALQFDGERFFGVNSNTGSGADVYSSEDGIAWITEVTLGSHGLSGSAQTNNSSVLVGHGGAIYFFSKVELIESGDSTGMVEGGSDSYTFRLLSPPEASVTVTLAADADELELSVEELTFTVDNWNIAQTVTVSVEDDVINQGDRVITVSHVLTSADANYDGTPAPDVEVSISDNDIANIDADIPATLVVSEAGATVQYSLVLETEPLSDVVITITPAGRLQASTAALTFTPSNWSSAQSVTLSVIDDAIAQGDLMLSVTHAVTSGDATYNGFVVPQVTVSVIDNDTANILVTSAEALAVSEDGLTDVVTFVLGSEPTANVTVTLTPNAQLQVSQGAIVFTSANWNVPVNIDISAVDDDQREGDHTGVIAVAASSADPIYNNFPLDSLEVDISDNDQVGGKSSGSLGFGALMLVGLMWRRSRRE